MRTGYDSGDEFEYGLEVVLDGLEMARQSQLGSRAATSSHPEARPTAVSRSRPQRRGGRRDE